MIMKQDWLMRQIELITALIARILFGRCGEAYDLKEIMEERQADPLYRELWALLDRHELGTAEDRLFEALDPENEDGLLLAAAFYARANAFTDEELAAQGFTRDELLEGLQDAVKLYELDLPPV